MTGVPYQEWRSRAERLDPHTGHHIDGAFTGGGGTLPVVSPRDGRVLAEVGDADAATVDRAVAAARRAFDEGPWPRLPPADRRAALLRWADLVERDRDALALLVSAAPRACGSATRSTRRPRWGRWCRRGTATGCWRTWTRDMPTGHGCGPEARCPGGATCGPRCSTG
ncbi:hypothetical protein HNR61_002534 [Actinomadura namibiensis]|uniref:Aldehyde dehydrogenase domain-containing protein n=1 Tax=Actinomadura namibiensis TaxID=182080 RepID=A0A7W3LML2_ACTNM|nr:hypothetical protein [Actinomadura namibiensis]